MLLEFGWIGWSNMVEPWWTSFLEPVCLLGLTCFDWFWISKNSCFPGVALQLLARVVGLWVTWLRTWWELSSIFQKNLHHSPVASFGFFDGVAIPVAQCHFVIFYDRPGLSQPLRLPVLLAGGGLIQAGDFKTSQGAMQAKRVIMQYDPNEKDALLHEQWRVKFDCLLIYDNQTPPRFPRLFWCLTITSSRPWATNVKQTNKTKQHPHEQEMLERDKRKRANLIGLGLRVLLALAATFGHHAPGGWEMCESSPLVVGIIN